MNILGISVETTLLLSLWGAFLSTVLGVLKFFEYWNNRFRVRVTWILRGSEEEGHDVSIQNLSSKPLLLEYLEIFSKTSNDGGTPKEYLWTPEDSWLNARIAPHDTKVYNFSEADYFSWNKKHIYIRLYFAGRRPITKKIIT